MNNNQLPLVTYEQAKRLREAGFDWPVMEYYDEIENGERTPQSWGYNWNTNKSERKIFSAPTIALALKWMRDVKFFRYGIFYDPCDMEWFIQTGIVDGEEEMDLAEPCGSYEVAESALLDEALNLWGNEKEN